MIEIETKTAPTFLSEEARQKSLKFLQFLIWQEEFGGSAINFRILENIIQVRKALSVGYGQGWPDFAEVCKLILVKNTKQAAEFNGLMTKFEQENSVLDLLEKPHIEPNKSDWQEEPTADKVEPLPAPGPPPWDPFLALPPQSETGAEEASLNPKNIAETGLREFCLKLDLPFDRLNQAQVLHLWQEGWERPAILNSQRLDVLATVEASARAGGKFIIPKFKSDNSPLPRLIVFWDRGEAMQPFEYAIEIFLEKVKQTVGLENYSSYYFDEYPRLTTESDAGPDRFELYTDYQDGEVEEPIQLSKALSRPGEKAFLVISEAGAGGFGSYFNEARLGYTRRFLKELHQASSAHISWLNPIPRSRWGFTDTRFIVQKCRQYATMQEFSVGGLHQALKILVN